MPAWSGASGVVGGRRGLPGGRVSELRVWKYQATGNDFVMTHDPEDRRALSADEVQALCDRRFGVGADGSIRVTRGSDGRPFMDYRNADGSLAEMCGNGLRCVGAARFAMSGDAADAAVRGGDESRHASRGARGRRARQRGHGRAQLHEGGDPDARTGVGDVPPRAPRPRRRPRRHGERGVDGQSPLRPVRRRRPGSIPRRTHRARCSSATIDSPRAPTWSSRRSRTTGSSRACGSGGAARRWRAAAEPCAILVAANEAGLAPVLEPSVRFPGGVLEVERLETGSVLLTGPASRVFETTVDLDALMEPMTRDDGGGAARGVAPRRSWPSRRRAGTRRRSSTEIRGRAAGRVPRRGRRGLGAPRAPGAAAGAPLVILAGHVDTVPIGRSAPGRREGETLHRAREPPT